MDANDHRIAGSSFAIARGPHFAGEILPRALPEKVMIEFLEPLSRFELFPGAAINLAADSFDIKHPLGKIERLGLEAEVFDVVVPAWMLAERAKGQRRPAQFLEEKAFYELA